MSNSSKYLLILACPNGTFGKNCSSQCPADKYGYLCTETCECKYYEMCSATKGCIPGKTLRSFCYDIKTSVIKK